MALLTQEIWVALVFLDAAFTIFFFIALKEYWANLICAGVCYMLSTGLADSMTTGIDNGGVTVTDPWLASVFAWHSYLMLALALLALLKNTVLAEPDRSAQKGKGKNRNGGW